MGILPSKFGTIVPFIFFSMTYCCASVKADTDALEQITIIDQAEHPFSTGDVVSEETTGFSSSISQEQIQRESLTLGTLLDHESGAQVRESGGFGSYSEISLRGAGSNQVMVFLDGLLLNDGAGGGFDLSTLDPAQTSRIDIYRGSTPLQLGKSSFGGAINLISHTRSEKTSGRIAATVGSFNTSKLSASIRGNHGKNDGLVSLATAKSDNDFEYNNDNATQYNQNDDEIQKRNNANVSRHSALLKAGRELDENRRLDASLQLLDKHQGIPAWNNSANANASYETQSWQVRGKFTSDGHFDQSINTATELYQTRKTETYDDRNSDIGLGSQHNRYRTDTSGLKSYTEWLGNQTTAGLNLEVRQERYRRTDFLETKPDDLSKRHSLLATLQVNRFWYDDKLLVTPSIRYQGIKNKYKLESLEQTLRTTEHYTKPQLGLKYSPTDNLSFKSNVGGYIREPGFYELFGDRGLFLGNQDLVAEQGVNADIGIEWTSQSPLDGIAVTKIQASAWYNTIDDMIARTYDARGIGKSQNISSARLTGIDSSLQLTFNNRIRLSANLTIQNPENRSSNSAFNGKVLPGRDQQSFYSSLTIPVGQWSLLYEFDARSGRYYDTANLLKAENRQLHHVGLSYKSSSGLAFRLDLKNLTDKAHEDFNGYPRPGRAWYLSLSYEN